MGTLNAETNSCQSYTLNESKQLLYVTNKNEVVSGVTSSLPPPSSLRKLPICAIVTISRLFQSIQERQSMLQLECKCRRSNCRR